MKNPPENKHVAIAGAGFSGAVVARELAEAGWNVTVFDERTHVAGNCHTSRCEKTGVNVHRYGPHIFHTDSQFVWDYINRFGEMMPYVSRVKTVHAGKVYSLPVNLHTLNQLFGTAMSPHEAAAHVKSLAVDFGREPENFEEQALSMLGSEVYHAFFHGYTCKQWGMEPSELPASILKRLPVRFNYDDNYFFHRYQGIPKEGYTAIVEKILEHERIKVQLGEKFPMETKADYYHFFYSGTIDSYFGYQLGRLGYRSLRFEEEIHEGDRLGVAVLNQADADVPYTRETEHKHFAPWETHAKTNVFKEYSFECGPDDIPYYPIRLVMEKEMLARYEELAATEKGTTFIGRLGTYQYLDMDRTIELALSAAGDFLAENPR